MFIWPFLTFSISDVVRVCQIEQISTQIVNYDATGQLLDLRRWISHSAEITTTFEVFDEKEMFATVMEQEPGGE